MSPEGNDLDALTARSKAYSPSRLDIEALQRHVLEQAPPRREPLRQKMSLATRLAAVGASRTVVLVGLAGLVGAGIFHYRREISSETAVSREGLQEGDPSPARGPVNGWAPTRGNAPANTTTPAGDVHVELDALDVRALPEAPESSSTRIPITTPHAGDAEANPEVTLLRRAQRELAMHPDEALRLADSHQVRYPASMLAQERDWIAIQALSRLRRTREAAARAAQFHSQYPRSPYGQ